MNARISFTILGFTLGSIDLALSDLPEQEQQVAKAVQTYRRSVKRISKLWIGAMI